MLIWEFLFFYFFYEMWDPCRAPRIRVLCRTRSPMGRNSETSPSRAAKEQDELWLNNSHKYKVLSSV
jgi:hypothetical protein